MIDANSDSAVLTGDLVNSSMAGPAATSRALKQIETTLAQVEAWDNSGPGLFTRTRGDGWQFVVQNQIYTLRTSLMVFADLHAARDLPQTRIAIGMDGIDRVEGSDLSAATGPAFVVSGQYLDALNRTDRFAIGGATATPLHRAVITLVEDRISRWTPEQAEATALYLAPTDPTLKDIAKTLGISTQAVHSRIKGAGAQALRRAVKHWEEQRDLTPC